MNDDIEKTILRVILDFCSKKSINCLTNEFALTVTPTIHSSIEFDNLTFLKFKNTCSKRKDFFIANDLNIDKFCPLLYKEIKQELSYYNFDTLLDSLKEYKRRLENGNSRGFPQGIKEDALRSDLSNYIRYENFCEPRCSSGNCDIIIPTQKCIIETKLWHGEEYYNSGLPELCDYVKSQGYKKGYYVIYDYSVSENIIIKNKGEIFCVVNDGIEISVIFIRMRKVSPSIIYKNKKQK